ncbi:MAG: DNA gyrase inhibitor YacG [Casimicrobiaceae bacterium]
MKPRSIACPRCGARVTWTAAERWRPFCSERCKLIDFGAWASEAYRVPTTETPEIETEAPPDDRSPDRS